MKITKININTAGIKNQKAKAPNFANANKEAAELISNNFSYVWHRMNKNTVMIFGENFKKSLIALSDFIEEIPFRIRDIRFFTVPEKSVNLAIMKEPSIYSRENVVVLNIGERKLQTRTIVGGGLEKINDKVQFVERKNQFNELYPGMVEKCTAHKPLTIMSEKLGDLSFIPKGLKTFDEESVELSASKSLMLHPSAKAVTTVQHNTTGIIDLINKA